MAAHESPCTTTLYDGTGEEITLDEIERIAKRVRCHGTCRPSSNLPKQYQDYYDHKDEAEAAAAVVASAIKWAATEPAKATEQRDDQNNDDDRSERHGPVPLADNEIVAINPAAQAAGVWNAKEPARENRPLARNGACNGVRDSC
jgi:hypothetical protein